jgi:dTDP-4-dehydrorhamnose reductase
MSGRRWRARILIRYDTFMKAVSFKRVLVLGASGMAGHVIAVYLREHGFSVDTLASRHPLDADTYLVDVTNKKKLIALLDTKKYDVVINCIGILVRQSEERKDLAVYINAYLPHFLEEYYKNGSTRVLHISTDDVFAYRGEPPKEDSAYTSESFYGQSKALGEIINNKDLTFRTSIIGPDMRENGSGLFNWFLKQKDDAQGYTKTIWNGVTTLELAKAMRAAIGQNLRGIYHLAPSQSISKYDLLQLLKTTFNREDLLIRPVDGLTVNKTLATTRKDFNYRVADYPAMVNEMRDWIAKHSKLYGHYEN